MKTPLIEGVKEMFRIIVISVVPIILTGIDGTTGNIAIDWKVVFATVLIALIRFVDKWAHESEKKNPRKKGRSMRILPF